MATIATKKKYTLELSYNEILKLIKSLSIDDKIQLEKELEKETLKLRAKRLSDRISKNKITMEEIVSEVKATRKARDDR
jgi:hypothetical protein